MRTGHDCKAIDEPRCENVTDGFKNRAMSRGVKRKKGKEEIIMKKKVVAALMAVTMVAALLAITDGGRNPIGMYRRFSELVLGINM